MRPYFTPIAGRLAGCAGFNWWWTFHTRSTRPPMVPAYVAGAVLTETIFAWPGVGSWLIHGIARRDYPVLQGGILPVAAIVIMVNLSVDILVGIVNPRIRYRR